MKILFIHEVSYRKKVIFEMHEFPELLALRGHDISFLEFDEGRKFWKKGQAPKSEVIQGRVHPDARINLSRPFQVGIPGVDRILALVTVWPTLRKLLKNKNFDAVVLYAVPTYGLQTLWLAKRFKVPVLFRALDVSHKIRISAFSFAVKWIESKIYKHSNVLSANNRALADYCSRLGHRSDKPLVHFPPLELHHFRAAIREPKLRRDLGIKDNELVITYMGSFFHFSGLKDALQEFALQLAEYRPTKFLLIGGGEQDKELKNLVIELGISDHVIFSGFVSYINLPRYLKLADVAVNTLEPTLVSDVAFPNKVLQYMSAGLPVVSTTLTGLRNTFGDEAGITWAKDAREVVLLALQLLTDPSSSASTVIDQYKAIETVLAPGLVLEKFEKAIDSMVRGGE